MREPQRQPLINALTIDVEDYFQVTAFEKQIPRHTWDTFESRVVANTHRILRLLDTRGVRATFFILGWVARHYPELVRDIHRDGHEVGSHSYWHQLIYHQSPAEFRQDLRLSRDVLQDILGERITAFRAPSFSITNKSLWALDILSAEGFRCDSSIYPIYHDRYGIPNAQRHLHRLTTASQELWEFPPAVLRVGRMNLPVSGGGYFRLYPLSWTVGCLRNINRRQHQPFMFYIHPWELDPDQPRLSVGSRLSRARHYIKLASTERKLDRLLSQFEFGRMSDAIDVASQSCCVEQQPVMKIADGE